MKELHTPRLRLEPLGPQHAEAFFDGLSSESIYDFISDAPPDSVFDLRRRFAELARGESPSGSERWLNWAVWIRSEKRYVGYVQATVVGDREATLAYVFFPNAWGRGYAREAVKCMIDWLRGEYPDLELRAYVAVRNQRSISLLNHLGFACVNIRTRAELIRGVLSDEAEFRKQT
jgi:[ribosomal protein S5]-alanine N-acetyltransferase